MILLLVLLSFSGCDADLVPQIDKVLSPDAQALVDSAFAPFQADTLIDHHVHILGLGNTQSGIEVHPDTRSYFHPFKLTRFKYFMDAGSVTDEALADEQYLGYLLAQIEKIPGEFRIQGLALDRFYMETGEPDPENFEIYIPNEYVVGIGERFPDSIIPVISVHPYRLDAVAELEQWASQGVRVVKWLPNVQGIDPSSPLCDTFYDAMNRLNMVLLSHAGTELALDSHGRQHLGNPLLLRRALEAQVKVIVCHCGTSGTSQDLDDPMLPEIDNFTLFMRLFDDPLYEGLLFADISGMTLVNQVGISLKVILARKDLHPRLLYGSDYPLPAVDILNQNYALSLLGYIDEEIVSELDEIQEVNPLLYSFVLMRTLKHPDTGAQLSEDLFRNRMP
ncbi:MAG: amidohydrolase family protein [Candidatus Marinimicrobia bacterium]|nr:amidohydrolase family protein [Candidatus Neomarinimicrobiota bacterium]